MLRTCLTEAWKRTARPRDAARGRRSSSASHARSRRASTGSRSRPTACTSWPRTASTVLVETGAGADSAITDDEYRAAGAEIVDDADDVWARAGIVLQGEGAAGRRVRATCGPASCSSPTSTSPRTPRSPTRCSSTRSTGIAYETVQPADGALPAARADERGRGPHGARRSARTSSSASTAAAACCSAARPASARHASSCSAPATSAGTRRGSRRAWRPRCSCSTRTSTGCAGSTRSTRAGS